MQPVKMNREELHQQHEELSAALTFNNNYNNNTTTTTTTSSKIMKSELRYVPVAMNRTANEGISSNAMLHCPAPMFISAVGAPGSNTLLNVLPNDDGSLTSATMLPQMAFITTASTVPLANPQPSYVVASNTENQSGPTAEIPINFLASASGLPTVVRCGITTPALAPVINAVHTTNAPGLAGPILIRNNQPVQRGTIRGAVPLLHQGTVKKIVVGNTQITLLKSQIIQQRPPVQAQLLLQQQQQLPLLKATANVNFCMTPQLSESIVEDKVNSSHMLTIAPKAAAAAGAVSSSAAVTKAKQSSGRTTFAQAFKSKMMLPIIGTETTLPIPQHIKQSDVTAPPIQLIPSIMANAPALFSTPNPTMAIAMQPEQKLMPLANADVVMDIAAAETQVSLTSSLNNGLLTPFELVDVTIQKSLTESPRQDSKATTNETSLNLFLPSKAMEKQESLLKTKTTQQTIPMDGNNSPRAKRSKSLNYPLCQDVAYEEDNNVAERRHSTASVGAQTNVITNLVLTGTKQNAPKQPDTRIAIQEEECVNLFDEREVINLVADYSNVDVMKEPEVIDLIASEGELLENSENNVMNSHIKEAPEQIAEENIIIMAQEGDQADNIEQTVNIEEEPAFITFDEMQPEIETTNSQAESSEENQQIIETEQTDQLEKNEQQIDEQPLSNIDTKAESREIEEEFVSPDIKSIDLKMPTVEVADASFSKSKRFKPQADGNCEEVVQQSIEPNSIKLEVLDETDVTNSRHKSSTTSAATAVLNESMNLLCDEQILISSSSATSSSSNSSVLETSTNILPTCSKKRNSMPSAGAESLPDINSYSSMLEILSTFNMLNWRERIGSTRGTYLRFQLNEFNLLQIHERCPPRYHIHTAYEKPIFEREPLPSNKREQADPLLYLCRRCNCHGPAADFLAPEFCSWECLKRDTRKRARSSVNVMQKQARKEPVLAAPTHCTQAPHSIASIFTKKYFRWSSYLSGKYGNVAAPIDLFLNPFPTGPNHFQVGMKLEAIDPENCSLFCVCTVRAIQGYRLKLSFDGYEHMYDFWVNADSMDIFPPGWCAKTNRILQPPKGVEPSKFNWSTYLTKEKATPAHRHLFTHLNSSSLPTRNPFKIGMHLEAEDLNDTGKLCVATVADVLEERIRVHFDGWDNCYDYWVDISSPYIHPCGWHEGRQQLIVPPEFENYSFNWRDYICQQGTGAAAHEELFAARDPIEFKPNMKLEVVDPRNPSLIRPATVVGRKAHRIKLHLDCWTNEYCFWMEDESPDLHPIGWCDATGHDLEPPPGYQMRPVKLPCSILGCRGIGNAKRFFLSTHPVREACPYAPENWRQKVEKPARVNSDDVVRRAPTPTQNLKLAAMRRALQHHNPTAKSTRQHYLRENQLLEKTQLLAGSSSRHKQEPLKIHATVPTELKPGYTLPPIKQERSDTPCQKYEIDGAYADEQQSSLTTSESSKTNSLNGETATPPLEPRLHIAKNFLCDYGPRLRQNFSIWQKNMAFEKEQIKRNPMHWSTAEANAFVADTVNCSKTAACFEREDIDGAALLMLQQSDLTDTLGLKLGPAVKLYSHILQLRTMAVSEFGVELCAALK